MNSLSPQYGFKLINILDKGFATYIKYEGHYFTTEFICGPPSFEIYIIIYTKDNNRYELADLMKIKKVEEWVHYNVPTIEGKDKMTVEAEWCIRLIKALVKLIIDGNKIFEKPE